MSSPKLSKPCSSCTECQHSRQRCFFDTPDTTECSRCITRGLQCAFRRSFQGSRKKQKHNSSIVDEDQGGVDILDRQIGDNLLSTPVSGPPLCSESVKFGFYAKNQIAFCKTYTKGGGDVWYPTPSGELVHIRPTNRFTCPTLGDPLFLRASCIHNLKRCCIGSLVAFRSNASKSIGWRLGVLSSLHHLSRRQENKLRKGGDGPGANALRKLLHSDGVSEEGEGSIVLWQWKGESNNLELRLRLRSQFTPKLMLSQSWEELLTHMEYKKFRLNDIRMFYLNQIKGPVPLGLCIANDTRNHSDGGVQSSLIGPDLWESGNRRPLKFVVVVV